MHPPAHAVVLSIDAKPQIQSLDRTRPGLPLKPGKCATMTHDDKRHGTTTLFAAFNVLDGVVLGCCMQKHTHQEFIRFPNAVERQVPAGKLSTPSSTTMAHTSIPRDERGSPVIRAGRSTSPRPPVPGSAPLRTFFSALTRKRLRRGTFRSIVDLQAAINRYLKEHNKDPQPFVWTKPASAIFAKLDRLPVPSV